MKIEVITRHAVRNYGSALQALATQELLHAAGREVRFVDYRQTGYDDTGWSYANRGHAKHFNVLARAAYAGLRASSARRIGSTFERFLRSRLTLTERTYRSNSELLGSNEFSAEAVYCVGSDQVWNVEYNVDNRPYYLDFAPRGARKISLASSIGADRLPAKEEIAIKSALESFDGVSVREPAAADYLSRLGINAEQHADPTLAVDPTFWSEFAAPTTSRTPYVLVYQLNASPSFNQVVDAVSAAVEVPVKRIEYWRGPRSFRYHASVLPSVEEFVGLFKNAAFVVTDSFHGSVFSTTFRVPFVAVAPPKYSGRISSLLTRTEQSERLVESPGAAIDVVNSGPQLQDPIISLQPERIRTAEYLRRVLSGVQSA